MAIKGSLSEASLPDVLQLLALGQKTGCLTVTDRANVGYIYFNRGRICYAAIVNRRDRLGDILLKSGRITQAQLDAAIAQQAKERDRRLGEILVEQGAVSQEDLNRFMRMQIEEAVYFLFTWTRGTFNFEGEVRPAPQDFQVSINPESLLLEGARRVDEWSLIEKKIPSFDLIFEVDRARLASAEVTLTEEQERILPLLDGTRDVRHVVEESALGEFDVGKALYGLITAGFAHRVGQSAGVRTSAAGAAPVDEYRNLGVAFYRTGMLEESRREFRRVVELRPSDGSAYFYLGLIAIREAQWEDAAQQFTKALECGGPQASVYYNLALAHENAGRLDLAEEAYTDAALNAPHDWRILAGWGIAALRGGDLEVATARLDRAAEVAGDEPLGPLWYWARALAAAAQDDLEAAERILRTGLERHPHHPVLRNNLAVVLEVQDRLEEAVGVLEAALAEDPWLPQLSKNLGDLRYRQGRYDEAWEAYQRAVKLEPDLGEDVYFKLGNIAHKRLDRSLATTYWERALELNPAHELARANLEAVREASGTGGSA